MQQKESKNIEKKINIYPENEVRRLIKRAFSSIQKSKIGIEDSVVQNVQTEETPIRKEKRVNSVKGSPKVMIPISRKLPEIFKQRQGDRKLVKQVDIGNNKIESNNFGPIYLFSQRKGDKKLKGL